MSRASHRRRGGQHPISCRCVWLRPRSLARADFSLILQAPRGLTPQNPFPPLHRSSRPMNDFQQFRAQQLTRRAFLGRTASGLGGLALGSMMASHAAAAPADKWPGVLQAVAPKAKRVIWLTMAGGPSHLETFDHKPKLAAHARPADAREHDQRPADRPAPGQAAQLLRPAAHLQALRQMRRRDLRAFPAHRLRRRRHLLHPLDDTPRRSITIPPTCS